MQIKKMAISLISLILVGFLSSCSFNYKVTPEEADNSGSYFKHTRLRSLTAKEIKSMKVLNLAKSDVTDDDLLYLKDFENLRELNLSNTKITGRGLVYLKELNNLEKLNLDKTNVTDDNLAILKDFKKLGYFPPNRKILSCYLA